MAEAKTWSFDDYDWIDQYDERMRRVERLHYEETLRLLPELAEAQAADYVLDLGTGTGNSAVPFLERGCRVVGVDPSERMLAQAEAKAARWEGRLSVRRVDEPFLQLPFDEATFEVVVSAYAIHHLDERAKRQAIREMKRVLKPGGRVAIADTMFRDEAHKARALAEHADLEDEYQPLLTTFPGMFAAEGFAVTLEQVGELVWVLVARHRRPV
jgi:putative AdoMet-dependent methyltransferase